MRIIIPTNAELIVMLRSWDADTILRSEDRVKRTGEIFKPFLKKLRKIQQNSIQTSTKLENKMKILRSCLLEECYKVNQEPF
jgi:hypothetical protein